LRGNGEVATYRGQSLKNRFEFWSSDLSIQATLRLELEQELRRALERSELRPHYRRIISLSAKGVVAVEALIRWEHPTRGLLGPSEFLWRAEETGMSERIGRWVPEEACRDARWGTRERGRPWLGV